MQQRAIHRIPDAAEPERRLRSVLILIILALSSLFFAGYVHFFSTAGSAGNDFFVFWAAARFLQHGSLAGAYDPSIFYSFEHSLGVLGDLRPAPDGGLPFVYPPHAALLFLPFAHLPLRAALVVWDALSLLLYVAAGWQLFRPRAAATFAALIAPSTVSNLIYGQTGLLTGGLTMLGFGLLQRAPILAGVAFGLLSIKPQMAVLPLLVLLLSGNRPAILAAAATFLALLLASVAVFGPASWSDWLGTLSGFSTAVSAHAWHYQYGVTVYFTLLGLGAGRGLAIAVQGLVSLLVLWKIVRLVRRDWGPLAIMAVLVGLFLAIPYALVYDLPVISAVCLMMIAQGNRSGFLDGELLLAATAWCLPLLLMVLGGGNPVLALSVLVGLLVLILRRMKWQKAQDSVPA